MASICAEATRRAASGTANYVSRDGVLLAGGCLNNYDGRPAQVELLRLRPVDRHDAVYALQALAAEIYARPRR